MRGETDLVGLAERDEADVGSITEDYAVNIQRLYETIASGFKKEKSTASGQVDAIAKQVKRDAFLLKVASMSKAGVASFINFSPIRKYPQIHVGKSSLNDYFSALWASVDSAACVSATLYLPKTDGTRSAAYIQNILNIPRDRALEFLPVVPDWVKTTVQEFKLVDLKRAPSGRVYLRRPSRKDNMSALARSKAETIWLTDIADELEKIYSTAEGGVLVLMTAYALAEELYDLLPENVRDHAILSKPKTTISDKVNEFHERSASGERVLWLAVGSAWTGINVGGHEPMTIATGTFIPAAQDNVLTDLVIPALPFGTNKTITHLTRCARNKNSHVEIVETLFKTMQGIGRLVRREGLPKNRRVHILDARLADGTLGNMRKAIEQIAASRSGNVRD